MFMWERKNNNFANFIGFLVVLANFLPEKYSMSKGKNKITADLSIFFSLSDLFSARRRDRQP